jgi:hypothetical protein
MEPSSCSHQKLTTERNVETASSPSPNWIVSALSPELTIAATVFVVPKSIPIACVIGSFAKFGPKRMTE